MIMLGQPRRDPMPRDMVLRVAMQQEQRRARAAMTKPDDRAAGGHVLMLEPGKFRRHFRGAPYIRRSLVVRQIGVRRRGSGDGGGCWFRCHDAVHLPQRRGMRNQSAWRDARPWFTVAR